MTASRITRAARRLADRRIAQTALDQLPAAVAPGDEVEAYAIQDALHPLLTAAGWGEVVGHKIGCTTEVMQRYLGVSEPAAGAVFGATVHRSPARLRHTDYVRPGVECELAVWLARDLPEGGRTSMLWDAVEAVALAMEIVDDRYRDWASLETPTLVADDFFGAGCVLGDITPASQAPRLGSVTAQMLVNDRVVGSGSGVEILGDPLAALAWIGDNLARRGRPLRAGQFVLLGSMVQTAWIAPGDAVALESPALGRVSAQFG
jgi:2-keto-4-pentenoate hydratase